FAPAADLHVAGLQKQSEVILQALGLLVEQQARLWSDSLRVLRDEQQDIVRQHHATLTDALHDALEQSLVAHEDQLVEMRLETLQETREVLGEMTELARVLNEQHTALVPLAESLTDTVLALRELHKQEGQLVRLHHLHEQNLHALAESGAFEEAL